MEEETGGRKGQWRVLNRMINIMTEREEFFEMMQTLAEKRFQSGEGVSARELDALLFGDIDDEEEEEEEEGGKVSEGTKDNKK